MNSFRAIVTYILTVTLCLSGVLSNAGAQGLPPMNLSQMYSLASDGNVKALRYASQRGLNLDATDKYGNTGICHAILQRNYTAYNTLRAAGASARHSCVGRIPTRSYDSFMSSRQVTPIDEVPKEIYKGYSRGEFTLSKRAMFWGAILGGGALAIALTSGGGGGGSKGFYIPPVVEDPNAPKDLGGLSGIAIPQIPGTGYLGPVIYRANGTNFNLDQDLTLKNESIVLNTAGDDYLPLTVEANFDRSITEYAKYFSVGMKADNGGHVEYGLTSGTNKYMRLGNNTIGMIADNNSTAVNNDEINIKGQNAIVGMVGSNNSYITNNERIIFSMISDGGGSIDEDELPDLNAWNQVVGMYVDTHSGAINNGTIDGIIGIDGTLVGMQSRLINEEIDPSTAGTNVLINSAGANINLGITVLGEDRVSSVVGMGTFYDEDFLNGNKRFVLAHDTLISNSGSIYLTLNKYGEGNYEQKVTSGNKGVIGILAGANTTATNEVPGKIRVYVVDDDSEATEAHAGMVAMHGGSITNLGTIDVLGGIKGYGMLGVRGPGVNSEINFLAPTLLNETGAVINIDSIEGVGMASLFGGTPGGALSTVTNNGTININKTGVGMKMVGYGTATNNGDIYITDTVGGENSRGMWAEQGGTIINNGTIEINVSNGKDAIGMYATGIGSKAINRGTIAINGNSTISNCVSGVGCVEFVDDENGDPTEEIDFAWIKVDSGATFENGGIVYMRAPLNFSSMLSDEASIVEIGKGGSFIAPEIEGTIHASASIVASGFEKVYVNEDSFVGEDKGIDLVSNSALFDAELRDNGSGGHDVVMTMKQFDSVVTDAQIAQYLQSNYDLGNGAILMSSLKSAKDLGVLNGMVIQSLGLDTIPNFAKQNIDVLKSLNAKMHESLFAQELKDERIIIGYDHYYRDQDGLGVFTGYEDKANSVYALGDKKYDDNFRYGLGISLTQYESDYDNNNERKEAIVQIFAPLTFMLNEDLKLLSIPRIGYGFGDYQRKANGIKYGADTENYYYGITNELRKSFDMGMFILEPTLEFNVLGLYQDDTKENHQGLEVKSSNNLSIEGGLGLYAAKEFELTEVDTLRLRLGGTYYYELNNPYQAAEAKMSGMAGSYHMESYEAQRNRGVLSLRADYQRNMLNFYIQLNQYFEDKNAFSFNAGIGYMF